VPPSGATACSPAPPLRRGDPAADTLAQVQVWQDLPAAWSAFLRARHCRLAAFLNAGSDVSPTAPPRRSPTTNATVPTDTSPDVALTASPVPSPTAGLQGAAVPRRTAARACRAARTAADLRPLASASDASGSLDSNFGPRAPEAVITRAVPWSDAFDTRNSHAPQLVTMGCWTMWAASWCDSGGDYQLWAAVRVQFISNGRTSQRVSTRRHAAAGVSSSMRVWPCRAIRPAVYGNCGILHNIMSPHSMGNGLGTHGCGDSRPGSNSGPGDWLRGRNRLGDRPHHAL